jgi:hypothetical protein
MGALEWANAQVGLDPGIDEAARLKFVEAWLKGLIIHSPRMRDG